MDGSHAEQHPTSAQTGKGQAGDDRRPPRVVIVGGGFGGVYCARRLEKLLPPGAEIVVVSVENFMLYTPLMPEAAAGVLQPRHIGVPLRRVLRRSRVVLGEATAADLEERTLTVQPPEGEAKVIGWDRLVLAPGSVSRIFPIPGLEEHGYGFKSLAEGIHIRNHVLRMLELADATDDPAERRKRCTFVVIGAGYSGTELIAELHALVMRVLPAYPRLRPHDLRWILADVAGTVLPELGDELGPRALSVLRARGIEVRLGTSVEEVGPDWVRLTDGETVPMKTFVWTAGVTPDPFIEKLGLPTDKQGRLVCDAYTRVQGRDDVFAIGDAAAIPDPARPGRPAPPTAQHAVREGRVCATNVAASLGIGQPEPFRFKGLGMVVSLAERQGVANILGVRVTGLPAWLATRGYHLIALPTFGRKLRVLNDWLLALGAPPDLAELGQLGRAGPLSTER
jgi:NADH:ubiquinone reductase (H+-translocating)